MSFEIATQVLSTLGKNIIVNNGTEKLAGSDDYYIVVNGVTFSINGYRLEVKW